MNIKCERCSDPMHTVFYEGVAIQLCMSCKGVFLSKKKLEMIEESQEFNMPEDMPIPRRKYEVLRNCPECQTAMKKVKYGRIRTTVIDYCDNCNGVWLDNGEIASIQINFEAEIKNRMRNQFRRIS